MQEVPLNPYEKLRLKRIAENNKRLEDALLNAHE
jgi:hypothetical protein